MALALAVAAAFWLLVVAVALVVWALGGHPAIFLVAVVVAVVLWTLGALLRWRRHATTRFTVTSHRIYAAVGRMFFRLHFTTHEKITDIHLVQGPLGRRLGYGTVVVSTAGGNVAMPGARDPMRLRAQVEAARRRFLEDLLAGAPAARRATAVAQAPDAAPSSLRQRRTARGPARGPARVVWSGGPCGLHLAGRLVAALPALVFVGVPLALLLAALFGAGGLAALPVLLLTAFALWAAVVVAAHRRARYEVTDRGVRVTTGLATRLHAETTFDKITDVSSHQGVLGRILGFGNISINTAGSHGAPIHFLGVARPDQVKVTIERIREEAA